MTKREFQAIPLKIKLEGDLLTREVKVDDSLLNPWASQRERNHSPDGFSWGYSGSGCAQLALAVLLTYLPKYDAIKMYQNFKFNVIAGLPQSSFAVEVQLREEVKKLLPPDEVDDLTQPDDVEEKQFLIDGDTCTLNEFLHVNTGPDQPPLEESLIIRVINLKVGEVINNIDPNYPEIERVK